MALWVHRDEVLLKSAKAYLLITANNKCVDLSKRKSRYDNVLSNITIDDIEEVRIESEVLGYIHKLIDSLPLQQKRLILMKYKDGRKVKDIAAILKINPQTVSTQLNTAITKIRSIIKNRGIDHG
jgi:RNA polymerase sigma-70 factor (ECF subfamily)